MKKYTYFTILIVLVAFLGSCKDDDADSVIPDFSSQITASIGGMVLDENGNGVSGATVTLGTTQITTSPYGVFLFKSVSMDSKRAFIKVNKAGYFLGSRVIKPNANTLSNVRIKLLPKTSAGSFTNSSGGTITSTDGVELEFTSNSIIVEGGGAYSGSVDVAIQFLDPNAADMFDIMPGDLKGVDIGSEEMGLKTFGMVAVELTGSAGEKLNLASGSTAALKVPLSGAYVSEAQSSIPLWYFDEEQGIWKEEGSAMLVGSSYEGEVSHFSFWNCDQAFRAIEISGVVACNGVPREGAIVTIKTAGGNTIGSSALTATDGSFGGWIPKDEVLTISVSTVACGSLLHSSTIGPFSTNTTLPVVDACGSSTSSNSIITARLLDCDGNPIVYGGLRINNGTDDVFVYSDANGNINTMVNNCGQSTLAIQAFEQGSDFMGSLQNVAVSSTMALGDISTCDEQVYYLDISYNGGPVHTFYDGFNGETVRLTGDANVSTINAINGNKSVHLFVRGNDEGTFDVGNVKISLNPSETGNAEGPTTGVQLTYTTLDAMSSGTAQGTFTGGFVNASDGVFVTVAGSFKTRVQ